MSAYDNNPVLPTASGSGPTAAQFSTWATAVGGLRDALMGAVPSEGGAANYFEFAQNTGPPSSASNAAALYTDGGRLLALTNGETAPRQVAQTVQNISALRNVVPTNAGPVHVQGFSMPGDGGGGVFVWDTTGV